jgi:peptidoglycan hydrolase CwlO-like protein
MRNIRDIQTNKQEIEARWDILKNKLASVQFEIIDIENEWNKVNLEMKETELFIANNQAEIAVTNIIRLAGR